MADSQSRERTGDSAAVNQVWHPWICVFELKAAHAAATRHNNRRNLVTFSFSHDVHLIRPDRRVEHDHV